METLIISKFESNIYVAFFDEKEKMVQCHPYLDGDQYKSGDVYLGIVRKKVKGIEAYFIDYGDEKEGFLPFKNANKTYSPGESVMVQIEKEAYGTKGAKLTTYISLSGESLVLISDDTVISVSKKIPKDNRLKEMKGILRSKKKACSLDVGFILRTNAYDMGYDRLTSEADLLIKRYKNILDRSLYAKVKSLIYSATHTYLTDVQNMNKKLIESIQTDDMKIYDSVVKYFREHQIDHIPVVYREYSLFLRFDFPKAFKQASYRDVFLSSGASIVIEQTEAMYVVDVNSNKNIDTRNSAKNILKINIEAGRELARQIRLRNLSGIIIVDFITMDADKDKESLIGAFRQEIAKDPTPTVVHGLTSLGLMEVTRKRIQPSLEEILTKNT